MRVNNLEGYFDTISCELVSSDYSFASVFTDILHDGPCPHCLIYSYLEKMGRKFFLQMLDKKPKF